MSKIKRKFDNHDGLNVCCANMSDTSEFSMSQFERESQQFILLLYS